MEERWIILASYAQLPEANQDADTLKEEGVDCHITLSDPGRTLTMDDAPDPWIYLEVREEDFEIAAEILELEPSTVEDFDDEGLYESREARRRGGLIFWGGIFSLIIIARLLADLLGE